MSKIGIIGIGYVGLVSGTCLADFGHDVLCVDINEEKVNNLKKGIIPIYEPGLQALITSNMHYKRLQFTTDIDGVIESCEILFIAVGTPPAEDGSADLQQVFEVAENIAAKMTQYKVIVNKSTVPIGTGKRVKDIIRMGLQKRGISLDYDVVSNPEFLREGSAIYDFTHPDRIVIGAESEIGYAKMKEIYNVLNINQTPFVLTNYETAEMIKYASNAFLAMKITYINEIANLCEHVGANVQEVASAMGKDGRIGPKFLHAGPGYGGSCFPKDTKALVAIAKNMNAPVTLIESTIKANEKQKQLMVTKILNKMGDNLQGKTIAVLGITFKPNTDDLREAPSLVILPELIKRGAYIQIYEPSGENEGSQRFVKYLDSVAFCKNEYEAIQHADAIIILTEWNRFRSLDFDRILKQLNGKYFFDFRNIYNPAEMEALGFDYSSVGR